MENVVEAQTEVTQAPPVSTDAPVVQSESAQPEKETGAEGAGETETPQKRESRRQRKLTRERDARIAAETELRLLKEAQARTERQPAPADDGAPKREQFQTYEEFIEARADWRAEQRASETVRKALEESKKSETESKTRAEQDKTAKEWNAKVDTARDDIEDFDEVCAESQAVVTQPMSAAILESDKGAHIAYYLAKNPQEAERISKLSPSKQAAAIVALEDKVARPAKRPSNAPAPISPVGKRGAPESEDHLPGDDTATFIRKEKARMEKLGIR